MLANIKHIPKDNNKKFKCPYCKEGFTRESSLSTHLCEQKRRHQSRNDKNVKYGLRAFIRFFELHEHSVKTWDDFSTSQFYTSFVKFGSLISNINPIYKNQFIDHMCKSRVKLHNWSKEDHYYKFAVKVVQNETAEQAMERAIETMIAWGDKFGRPWNAYFDEATTNTITYDIKDGRISPWIIFNSEKAKTRLTDFTDSELDEVTNMLDHLYWYRVFTVKKADVSFVKSILEQSNI